MAYCGNCGAYLPDGVTKCVACGCVVGAEGAAQAAQQPLNNDDALRIEYEKQQEAIKNQSEQWAQQAGVQPSGHSTSQHTGGTPTAQMPADNEGRFAGSEKRSKLLGIMSYVGIFCLLPFIFAPNDQFAKFHGKQGVVLFLFGLVIDLLGSLSNIVWILSVFRFFLMIKGMINVSYGKMEQLPFIGKFAEKL